MQEDIKDIKDIGDIGKQEDIREKGIAQSESS